LTLQPPHVAPLHEVAVCFGGRLMRGNRTRKVDSSKYQVCCDFTSEEVGPGVVLDN
jgi:hypothetical protein